VLTVRQGSTAHRGLQAVAVLVLLALVAMPPLRWNKSGITELNNALIISMAVVGLNLLIGFTGQISIGHSAFFGLGAYTGAILVKDHGWSPGWTLPAAVVVCFVVGVIVGVPALRLQGLYLAAVTLALAVAFPAILLKFESVTGGADGVKGIRYLSPEWTGLKGRAEVHLWFYWLCLGLLALSLLLVRNLVRSRVGRAMIALRDNEPAAQIMGINLALTKTVTFGISAAIAGLAGALFAFQLGLVSPTGFTLLLSINLLVTMVVGGPASLAGPVLGGLLYVYGRKFATNFGEDHDVNGLGDLMFGALLIAFVFLAPSGLAGLVRKLRARIIRIVPSPIGGGPVADVDVAEAASFEPLAATAGADVGGPDPNQPTP
jgi:branched-chain amino acid transport system permease protein